MGPLLSTPYNYPPQRGRILDKNKPIYRISQHKQQLRHGLLVFLNKKEIAKLGIITHALNLAIDPNKHAKDVDDKDKSHHFEYICSQQFNISLDSLSKIKENME